MSQRVIQALRKRWISIQYDALSIADIGGAPSDTDSTTCYLPLPLHFQPPVSHTQRQRAHARIPVRVIKMSCRKKEVWCTRYI